MIVQAPVYEFARRLAPEQRRATKAALRALREEQGDIQPLEGNLAGYYRLRTGKFRLSFRYSSSATIEAVMLEERGIVYDVFAEQFLARLRQSL